jgi:hypothetical protein
LSLFSGVLRSWQERSIISPAGWRNPTGIAVSRSPVLAKGLVYRVDANLATNAPPQPFIVDPRAPVLPRLRLDPLRFEFLQRPMQLSQNIMLRF